MLREHEQTNNPEHTGFFDEDQVKRDMSAIYNRVAGERRKLRDAYEKLMKKEAAAHLAIKFVQPSLLENEKARDYLQLSIDHGVKLIGDDVKKLTELECEAETIAYNLAKFDVTTSDSAYSKLESQLSYLQSEMKLR